MEALVPALGGLLLKAVPTIILLILVHFYLKLMLFGPLQEVLRKRREATEGAREAGQKSLALAAEKATTYDLALKEARAEMYREQEETRRQWLEQQTSRIEEARNKAHATLQDAGQKLDSDVAEARKDLASRSQMLALQIVETLASGRPK
jgi:F-type H+-transporting ATPase subunit b